MRTFFIYALYWAAQLLGLPVLLLYLAYRGLRDPRYWRHIGERFGRLPHDISATAPGGIWLHAVSVGEVLAARELLKHLRRSDTGLPLFLSTTTQAGRAAAEQHLGGVVNGIFYMPIDYRFAVRAVLRRLRPGVLVVMETEIWPNLFREARRSGAQVIIINGRISDRAFPRYRRGRWFFRAALSFASAVRCQTRLSLERFLAIGAPAGRCSAPGNLKFDFDPDSALVPPPVEQFLASHSPQLVWVAASTMPPAYDGDTDEELAVVRTFEELSSRYPGLLLVLVPRKPERFPEAAALLAGRGISFVRRSELQRNTRLALPGVLLVDTIGELAGLFRVATVVFMGGTLAARGGHNILEPAAFGVPIIAGPHLENFPEIAEEFDAAGALVRVAAPAELPAAVSRLLDSPSERAALGARARKLAEAGRGVTGRLAEEICELREQAIPAPPHTLAAKLFLWPLARLFELLSIIARRRGLARSKRLPATVISTGGLSMGGSGKTPAIIWLARQLRETGLRPAVLIRGYRRKNSAEMRIYAAGETADPADCGDEATLILASGAAALGVGANRYETGRVLAARHPTDLFLLDDGFQHWRLARDFDLVLIDVLDPFAGGDIFPFGRLREPPQALVRASAILLTRCEPGRTYQALCAKIREFNPQAPIFRSRVVPKVWVPHPSSAAAGAVEVPSDWFCSRRVAAFCGLGNPAGFGRTLEQLGILPLMFRRFADHHRYSPREVASLARACRQAGAEALLTTEKDLANCDARAAEAAAGVPLYALRIDLEVEESERLLEVLVRLVKNRTMPAR